MEINKLQVKNWNKFQHYKDRNPPWIKLATDIFQNYEFSRLEDASKLLAICIFTLASRSSDGSVPYDLDYIKRQCNLGSSIKESHINELIKQGLIVNASVLLAGCKQDAIPETYREEGYSKEVETESITRETFEKFFEDFPKLRRGNRDKANTAYRNALKRATAEEIYVGLQSYRSSSESQGKYAKGATAWLNDDRWTNQYEQLENEPNKSIERSKTTDSLDALLAAGDRFKRKQPMEPGESSGGSSGKPGSEESHAGGVMPTPRIAASSATGGNNGGDWKVAGSLPHDEHDNARENHAIGGLYS